MQVFLSVQLNKLDQVLCCSFVELPPLYTGINKGLQTDACNRRSFGSHVPEHMGNYTLGQVIRLNLVLGDEFLDLCGGAKVTTDNPVQKPLVG